MANVALKGQIAIEQGNVVLRAPVSDLMALVQTAETGAQGACHLGGQRAQGGPDPFPTLAHVRHLMEVHKAHAVRRAVSDKMVGNQLRSIQRQVGLPRGMAGGWDSRCEARLIRWITKVPFAALQSQVLAIADKPASDDEKDDNLDVKSDGKDEGESEGKDEKEEEKLEGKDDGESSSSDSSSDDTDDSDDETELGDKDKDDGESSSSDSSSDDTDDSDDETERGDKDKPVSMITDEDVMSHPVYENLSVQFDEIYEDYEQLKNESDSKSMRIARLRQRNAVLKAQIVALKRRRI